MSSKQTFSALNPTPQLSARNLGGKSYSQIGLQRVSSVHSRRQSTWLYLHSICPAQSLSCVFISVSLCFLEGCQQLCPVCGRVLLLNASSPNA